MRRLPAAGLLLGVAVWAALGGVRRDAVPVYAHAILVRADPPVNAQLREPPTTLSLYFSEALERRISTVRVLDSAQQRVDTGFGFDDQDDALLKVALGPLKPGYFTIIWETLSKVDGHRISGSYPITLLNPDGSLPPGQAPGVTGASVSGAGARPDRVATKWVLLLGGSLLVGALAFTWVAAGLQGPGGDQARAAAEARIVATAGLALIVLALAGFVELALQASSFGGLGKVSDLLGQTRWGNRWIYRNLLLIPVALFVFSLSARRRPLWGSRAAVIGAMSLTLAYLALVSSVSHGAAGAGAFWSAASDFVHLTAASLWTGLLVQFVLGLRWASLRLTRQERPAVLAAALHRFSLIALASVAALLFTGTLNAFFEVERFNDLVNTAFGRALLIKLILVVPLLIAGGVNAYVLRPDTADEALYASRRRGQLSPAWDDLEQTLRRTVRIEAALVVLVLLAAGVLSQTSPARTALSAPKDVAGKFVDTKKAGDVSVTLSIDPNQPGLNTFETYLTGAATSVERVRLRFDRVKGSAGGSDLVLDASNPPTFYVGRGPYLATGGDWKVTVDLRRNQGTDLSIPFAVRVAAPGGVIPVDRGGGIFAWPRPLSAGSAALIGFAGLAAVALVAASWPRPEQPAGVLGAVAGRVSQWEVRPSVSLTVLIAAGIGLGLLVGAHAHKVLTPDVATQGNPIKSSAQSIDAGRRLFVANCTQCHGDSGRGDGPLAKSLPIPPANLYDHVPYHPDQFFYGIITNGLSGIMPAFGSQLSEDDRWNILNFLRSQFGQPAAAQ